MKIKYDLNNYYKMYGEANYFYCYKKQYLNGKKSKINNLHTTLIKYVIFSFLLLVLSGFIKNDIVAFFADTLFYSTCIMFYFSLLIYFQNKKYNTKGTLTINKSGITDVSTITSKISWDQIELIGLTKNVLVLLVKNSPVMILLQPNKEVLDEIKKYTDSKVIVD